MMIVIFVVLMIFPSVAPLSFNFTSFASNDASITYERSYPENNAIQLTTNNRASFGRATYAQPMLLWDKTSRNVTNFTTHFSFVIDSRNRTRSGDGLAFFLAPNGSRIPNDTTRGGSLALVGDSQRLNSTDNPFVAVEFDIYENHYDPIGHHVGIDVNSMRSVANVTWWSSILDGKKNEAWISYNSVSKNLSVVFTGFRNNATVNQSLYYIVDLRDYLPDLVTFGFSAATGNQSAIHSIYSWDFSSTLHVDESTSTSPVDPNAATPSTNPEPSSSKSRTGLVVGLAVGGSVLVGGLGLALFVFWKKRNRRGGEDDSDFDLSMDGKFERGTIPRKFSYAELARATNDFAEEEKLGEGGFGGVYRGFSRDLSSYIAVKRVARGSKQGMKEYASEVMIISRLRHRNLVQLIGWCHEKGDLLLVYELMPNGSLDSHLFKERTFLAWPARYRIAQGLASALLYLHEEWEQCVVHRDIKSSNIMLDLNFNAKLGDFGLARLVDHEKGMQTTVLAGTIGYMAPELLVITGKASKESDVYSFGVVALEIACGRKHIITIDAETHVRIVDWVWNLYGTGKLLEAADPKLSEEFDKQEMERLMIVGLWCGHPDKNLRPSIRQAIQVLNFEAPLPILPTNMPVPSYTTNISQSSQCMSCGTDASGSSQISSSGSGGIDSSNITISSAASYPSTSLLFHDKFDQKSV